MGGGGLEVRIGSPVKVRTSKRKERTAFLYAFLISSSLAVAGQGERSKGSICGSAPNGSFGERTVLNHTRPGDRAK